MARTQPTTFVALPSKPRQPIITLESLGASQHVSRSEERETPKKSRERSFSPAYSDGESSTALHHGSPNGDEDHTYGMPSSSSSHPINMQVMVTGAATIEKQIANLMGAVEKLTKTVEEKDLQIAELWSKLQIQDEEKEEKREREEENSHNTDKNNDGSLASMSFQQLQDIITNSIKAQYGGPSRDSLVYSKPYTKRIDGLRMPFGYQPPKFQQFEGKGNPKQHVAHFIETCNNAGTEGDHLVKQFVRSLKGNAFEWYTDLEPESINSWDPKNPINRWRLKPHPILSTSFPSGYRNNPPIFFTLKSNFSFKLHGTLSLSPVTTSCSLSLPYAIFSFLEALIGDQICSQAHKATMLVNAGASSHCNFES
ncbi:hypothetical protein ACLB2K_046114 [Fragaria x ananassa]